MNFTYRKATMAERDAYLDFANLVFSNAHRPHDFATLIPKVYGPGRETASMQHIALDERSRIRGLVALMPNTMKVLDEELKTGYIGTVSVHPYARGEGHMKHLVKDMLDDSREQGMDLLMLGGQRQRYEYFGFTTGGMQWQHEVNHNNLRHAMKDADVSGVSIEEITESGAKAIADCVKLHNEQKIHAARSEEEFYLIATTWYARLFSIAIDGAFAGYFIAGVEDHEMGISELALKDANTVGLVLKALMEKMDMRRFRITTPDCDVELNRALGAMEEGLSLCHNEKLQIFHFDKVIGAFLKLKASYAPVADGEKSFLIDGEPLTVRVKGGKVSVTKEAGENALALTAMDAQRLFFDLQGGIRVGYLPAGWAPLPLYLSSPDHF